MPLSLSQMTAFSYFKQQINLLSTYFSLFKTWIQALSYPSSLFSATN
jgi:hypothetical protein